VLLDAKTAQQVQAEALRDKIPLVSHLVQN